MLLEERLDLAEEIIRRPSFRQNKGLGNEVGYYIFDYPAEQELMVRQRIEYIRKKYENAPDGCRLIICDLYDMMMEILQEKGYLDKTVEMEEKRGFERVVKAVGSTLRLTTPESLIISRIREMAVDNSIIFITGVGKAYPIIRSHTILNNLHQVVDKVPVVMFYPGKYDGQELMLFGEIKDDNYYRAFKLVE